MGESDLQRTEISIPGAFVSGTSGLSVLPPIRGFPPEFQDKSRLTYYSSLFNSIEVNSSFYKVPQASTMRKWAGSVSEDFRFTFKLWKEITHTKGLIFRPEDIHHFISVISDVGSRKGCLLVQFPPSLPVEYIRQLEHLLQVIQDADPENLWKTAIEFRNRSWYIDDTYDLLNHFRAGMVLHDLPASSAPMIDSGDFIYLRFHGPNGGYRGSYADDFLYEYAGYIHNWRQEEKNVYAYFNNTMGEAFKNLMTLNRYVSEADF